MSGVSDVQTIVLRVDDCCRDRVPWNTGGARVGLGEDVDLLEKGLGCTLPE
jgi:hypothetical protein